MKQGCNCDCHKETAWSELKKCKENNKRKPKELGELRKKLLIVPIVPAVLATLAGKDAVQWFQTFDKVKQTIDKVDVTSEKFSSPNYGGISPSPSTLGLFALAAFLPVTRRK